MIKINLLPEPIGRKIEFLVVQVVMAVAAIAVVFVACYQYGKQYDGKMAEVTRNIQVQRSAIEAEKAKVGELKPIEEQQNNLQKQIDVIRQLEAGRSGPAKMLDELSSLIPDRVWLKNFSEASKKIKINAEAVNKPSIADFIESLTKSKFFSEVVLEKVTESESGGRAVNAFDISCTVRYDA
jgi:type IV pilus assembly protein PilN